MDMASCARRDFPFKGEVQLVNLSCFKLLQRSRI
jgi:hypothetical protein